MAAAVTGMLLTGCGAAGALEKVSTEPAPGAEERLTECEMGIQIENETESETEREAEPVREPALPTRYDGREHGRTAPVKDQGDLGTCWAFASLLALKTSLLPEQELDFSEDHMSHNPNFTLNQEEGGEYTMAMAYLLSWLGPVAEADDPYGDGVSQEGLTAICHVQEIQLIPEQEQGAIKRAVLKYGGVQSSLYTTLQSGSGESAYYNPETMAYCYPEDTAPNHDVVIVGWDDEFPKEAFCIEVPGDGAFLCENSWGTQFGEEGFFYVSYYDQNLGKISTAYTGVEAADNYDSIYQSDLCGWIGQVGYGSETAWAMNVYTAKGVEALEAVGFYTIDQGSDYEVYIVPQVPEQEAAVSAYTAQVLGGSSDRIQPAASGHLDYAGYYTVPLAEAVPLAAGERFGIVVCITTPGAVHPIAVEYDAGDGKCRIDLGDGEGYISPDGKSWEGLEQRYDCNLCLKAYTSDR